MALQSIQIVGALTMGLWDRIAGYIQKKKEEFCAQKTNSEDKITFFVVISTPLPIITGSKLL